jgi:hypothetical protein
MTMDPLSGAAAPRRAGYLLGRTDAKFTMRVYQ